MIVKVVKVIVRFLWKRWWTKNDSRVFVYKAANWIHVGVTTGRGRMDRENKRHGMAVKEIYVYPLCNRFRQELLA